MTAKQKHQIEGNSALRNGWGGKLDIGSFQVGQPRAEQSRRRRGLRRGLLRCFQ